MSAFSQRGRAVQDPALVRALFNNPRLAGFWLAARLWLGYQWIEAALHKTENPAWMVTGNALKEFWNSAVTIPVEGRAPILFDRYRSLIQFMLDARAYSWFAKLVAYGELLVGIALILGAFTGIAAFFGAVMNWNLMLAGSASANPLLFVVALGLIMAWKIAGYFGMDYFLLPIIGTPWGWAGKVRQTRSVTETIKA